MTCSNHLKNNVIYIVMVSRKQRKHELVDDLLPIINKRLDEERHVARVEMCMICLLYTSPSPRDRTRSRMPSSA